MSGIARLFLSRGDIVSGSDIKESASTVSLAAMGARIFIGHDASNIKGADAVIHTSAVKNDNPEMVEALRGGITVMKRAQALAVLMEGRRSICVTGSHGKTTTSSLAAHLLIEAGFNPTVAVGGKFKNIDSNAASGQGDYFVAEADESDGSFLYYSPFYSIITNADREHLDHYLTFEAVLAAYREFMAKTDPSGCLFFCADDPNLAGLAAGYAGRKVSFGLKECDARARNIDLLGLSSEFEFIYKGVSCGRFRLSAAGTHNVSNALSVIAFGFEMGIGREVIAGALSTYKGAARRLDVKYIGNDYTVIDDYAHHPTEIMATLSAVKAMKFKRLVAVFQPHRYSRTKLLMKEFSACFGAADLVVLTDIYAASEQNPDGMNSGMLCEEIKKHSSGKPVEFVAKNELVGYISSRARPGDLILTLGAGDITKVSDDLAKEFSRRV